MENQLPVTITLNDELVVQFNKLQSITNKLEAQFNFQTMSAGWYGDEDNIVQISLSVESQQSFTAKINQPTDIEPIDYSDDVVSFFDEANNLMHCFVALTENEVLLLNEHPKLMASFVDKKLSKVLSLLAKELGFSEV